jgi:hypothetical protein
MILGSESDMGSGLVRDCVLQRSHSFPFRSKSLLQVRRSSVTSLSSLSRFLTSISNSITSIECFFLMFSSSSEAWISSRRWLSSWDLAVANSLESARWLACSSATLFRSASISEARRAVSAALAASMEAS